MSYQVKRTITSIFSGVVVLVVYCLYVFGRYQAGLLTPDDLKSWAEIMLMFVGIGIAVTIVIQIVFHILLSISIAIKENIKNGRCDDQEIEKTIELEMVEDEMDKLIQLKSMRMGFVIAGIGFVASLLALIFNYAPAVMLNILFISFSTGSLLEGFAQLYYYRKGVLNV